jgi:SAM-dependent methyltransferase
MEALLPEQSPPLAELRKGFEQRAPWVTAFDLHGRRWGGNYHAASDPRLVQFLKRFPNPGRVLELGALEGGHTFALAEHALEVIAIEGRQENLEKARWLNSYFQKTNIQFIQENIETADLTPYGRFDIVFNLGVLYHLPAPWDLLAKLRALTQWMLLWTHVAPSRWRRSRHPRAVRNGYDGVLYPEHGAKDPLSGMSPSSFWPTEAELIRMLRDNGFSKVERLGRERRHIHGPAVFLLCQATGSANS